MKKHVLFWGILGLVAVMAFAGCQQDPGGGNETPPPQENPKSQDPPINEDPPPPPPVTTGTLTLNNAARDESTILSVKIFEGLAPEGVPVVTNSAPIRVNDYKSWDLEPMAYYIQISDNHGWEPGRAVNIRKGETSHVNYDGFELK
ncbi:MAG: hypothetical protein LBH51_08230 [Treponema sp.]|jgi:hypothetical protein|nr:hypothetical protein [Treponema sp.]